MNTILSHEEDNLKKFIIVPLKEIIAIEDAQRCEFYFNPNCKATHPRIAILRPDYLCNVLEEDDCEM